jgi:hypothetical protein
MCRVYWRVVLVNIRYLEDAVILDLAFMLHFHGIFGRSFTKWVQKERVVLVNIRYLEDAVILDLACMLHFHGIFGRSFTKWVQKELQLQS